MILVHQLFAFLIDRARVAGVHDYLQVFYVLALRFFPELLPQTLNNMKLVQQVLEVMAQILHDSQGRLGRALLVGDEGFRVLPHELEELLKHFSEDWGRFVSDE